MHEPHHVIRHCRFMNFTVTQKTPRTQRTVPRLDPPGTQRSIYLLRTPRAQQYRSARLFPVGLPVALGGTIRTFLLLGLLAVVQPAIRPGQADPRFGSWTLISAQSSMDPPNRLSITPLHAGLHVVMSGET